jgi:hypothetical protein
LNHHSNQIETNRLAIKGIQEVITQQVAAMKRMDDMSRTNAQEMSKLAPWIQKQFDKLPEHQIEVREWYIQDKKPTSVGTALGPKQPVTVFGYVETNRWHTVIAHKKETYETLDAQMNAKE